MNSKMKLESEHSYNKLQNPLRLAYKKPLLTRFGEVRSMTLGPSSGTFESGLGAGFNENG